MNNVKNNVMYGCAIAGAVVGIIGNKKRNTLLIYASGLLGATGMGVALGDMIDFFAG